MSKEELLELLPSVPDRIASTTAGLSPARLRAAPADGGWSAVEVLAHLRACADCWGDGITAILAGVESFRAVNPRSWIGQTDYCDQPFGRSFAAYRRQRSALVEVLASLDPASWHRSAVVTGAGKPLERTVLDYADRLARHERSHLRQLAALTG